MCKHTSGFVKALKFEKICTRCNTTYLAADSKAKMCRECKKPKPCKCGCGVIVKSPRAEYAQGCNARGKTYVERYGREVDCGFKSGLANPNYNLDIKQKSNESLKLYYKNNPGKLAEKIQKGVITRSKIINADGDTFRSSWELVVDTILKHNNIQYKREIPVVHHSGKVKIVDFVINNRCHVEVTGFSYSISPELFNTKIQRLHDSLDMEYNYILLITNKQLSSAMFNVAHNYSNVFTCILEESEIIKKLNFIKRMQFCHQGVLQCGQ